MVTENPTIPVLLTNPETTPAGRIDPVRAMVQITLAVYLLPVILLVAVIGVIAIVVDRLVKSAAKVVTAFSPAKDRSIERGFLTHERQIGTRPIADWKRKRSRVIR